MGQLLIMKLFFLSIIFLSCTNASTEINKSKLLTDSLTTAGRTSSENDSWIYEKYFAAIGRTLARQDSLINRLSQLNKKVDYLMIEIAKRDTILLTSGLKSNSVDGKMVLSIDIDTISSQLSILKPVENTK